MGTRISRLFEACCLTCSAPFSLHQRIARLEAESQAGADVLDRWALGVVLLDSRGRVVLMNRSAEEILKQNDGLSLDAGGLSAAQANKTAACVVLVRFCDSNQLSMVTATPAAP